MKKIFYIARLIRSMFVTGSWIASLICIGGLIGNILFRFITNSYGRKWPLCAMSIPVIVSAKSVYHSKQTNLPLFFSLAKFSFIRSAGAWFISIKTFTIYMLREFSMVLLAAAYLLWYLYFYRKFQVIVCEEFWAVQLCYWNVDSIYAGQFLRFLYYTDICDWIDNFLCFLHRFLSGNGEIDSILSKYAWQGKWLWITSIENVGIEKFRWRSENRCKIFV